MLCVEGTVNSMHTFWDFSYPQNELFFSSYSADVRTGKVKANYTLTTTDVIDRRTPLKVDGMYTNF
jgi:hypothetical protein